MTDENHMLAPAQPSAMKAIADDCRSAAETWRKDMPHYATSDPDSIAEMYERIAESIDRALAAQPPAAPVETEEYSFGTDYGRDLLTDLNRLAHHRGTKTLYRDALQRAFKEITRLRKQLSKLVCIPRSSAAAPVETLTIDDVPSCGQENDYRRAKPAAPVERPKCKLCGLEDGACICAHLPPQRSSAGNVQGVLSCPFCGMPPLKSRAGETFIVHCGNSDCEAKCEITGASPEGVIEAWNKRSGAEPQSTSDTIGGDCTHRIAVTPRNGAPHGAGFACGITGGHCVARPGCGYESASPLSRPQSRGGGQ